MSSCLFKKFFGNLPSLIQGKYYLYSVLLCYLQNKTIKKSIDIQHKWNYFSEYFQAVVDYV